MTRQNTVAEVEGWRVGYAREGWLLSPLRGVDVDGELVHQALAGRSTAGLRIHPVTEAECLRPVTTNEVPVTVGTHAAPHRGCFCGLSVVTRLDSIADLAESVFAADASPVLYRVQVEDAMRGALANDPPDTWRGARLFVTGPILSPDRRQLGALHERYQVPVIEGWMDDAPRSLGDIPSHLTTGALQWLEIGAWMRNNGVKAPLSAVLAEVEGRKRKATQRANVPN